MAEDSKGKSAHAGLYVTGQGRKRHAKGEPKAKARPKGRPKGKAKPAQPAAPAKKTKLRRLKKAAQQKKAKVAKMNRGASGKLCVKDLMEKAKSKDEELFNSRPLFDYESGLCRLKVDQCHGMPWCKIRDAAHLYFKRQ